MTWNMMRIVGLKPILGRDFTEAEDVPGGPKVALISEGLWKRRFGGSPKVIGQQLMVDAIPREIVGVLPNEMQVIREAQVYLPLGDLRADKNVLQRDNHPGFSALGRLKPGVTLQQARADLDHVARDLTRHYPGTNTGRTINARTLLDATVGDYRQNLHLLLAAVACVLLIACANVANLQLARALARGKELAVRAAMGASRWRLMRLLLIESTVLGVVGGAAGILIAIWSLDAIHILSPPRVMRFQQTQMDFWTLGFASGIALLCGILVGIWPAWRVSRLVSLSGVLHEAGTRTGSDSAGRQRARGILVVTQVALALVLLAGAGLTLKSFWNSQNAALGFDPERYPNDDALAADRRATIRRRRWPISNQQLIEHMSRRCRAWWRPRSAQNVPFDDYGVGQLVSSYRHPAGAARAGALRGSERDFAGLLQGDEDAGAARAQPLVRRSGRNNRAPSLIDDSFAARYFPNQNPLGQHIDDNQTNDAKSAAAHHHWRCAAGAFGRAGRRIRSPASAADVFLPAPIQRLRKQPARAGGEG